MKRIDQDIANGQFQKLYLIYGEEDYLKLQYKNKLIKALVNEGDNMNFSRMEGNGASVPALIDQAETMPFFAEHRVILLENTGFAKKTPEDLSAYLPEIAETAVLIFVEKEINKSTRLYKEAKKCDRDIEINMPNEATLAKWVGARIKSAGKQMQKAAYEEFLNRTGESMDNMDRELEKLLTYVGERPQITLEDVREICIARVENNVFAMINAIAAKDLKTTFDLYHDMLSAKEPSMKILYLIVKQFRQMKVVKELKSHGENFATIAKKMGLPEFAVKKTFALSGNFSDNDMKALLEDAARFEKLSKTGQLDENMAVEMLITKYTK